MNKAEFLAGLRDALAGKCRCALCGGAVMLCVILELSIVPVLVGASARFVL